MNLNTQDLYPKKKSNIHRIFRFILFSRYFEIKLIMEHIPKEKRVISPIEPEDENDHSYYSWNYKNYRDRLLQGWKYDSKFIK